MAPGEAEFTVLRQAERTRARTNPLPQSTALGIGCVLALGGVALVYMGLVLEQGKPPLAVAYAGIVVGLCGALLLSQGIKSAWLRRRIARLAVGEGPWRADFAWDPRGARDGAWQRALHMAFTCALFWLFALPVNAFVWVSLVNRWSVMSLLPMAIAGITDLILLIPTVQAAVMVLRALKYRSVRIDYDAFPARTGSPLRVRFRGGERLARAAGLKAELACIQEEQKVETRNGRETNARMTFGVLYSETQEFATDGKGDAVLEFAVPPEAPGTDFSAAKPRYWEIEVKADVPGLDYHGLFPVPVYREG